MCSSFPNGRFPPHWRLTAKSTTPSQTTEAHHLRSLAPLLPTYHLKFGKADTTTQVREAVVLRAERQVRPSALRRLFISFPFFRPRSRLQHHPHSFKVLTMLSAQIAVLTVLLSVAASCRLLAHSLPFLRRSPPSRPSKLSVCRESCRTWAPPASSCEHPLPFLVCLFSLTNCTTASSAPPPSPLARTGTTTANSESRLTASPP